MSVEADAARCASCGEEIWVAEATCPFCGAEREPGTEADAHLYRSRMAVFGPVADAFRRPIGTAGVVPVSDWQYLRFLRDSRVLDTGASTKAQEAINRLELSSPEKIRGRESREAAREMLRGAERFSQVLRSLRSLRPSGRFAEVHPHFVAAFDAHRRAFAEVAEGIVSWHPAEAQEHADAVQPAFDEAAEEIGLASGKMDAAFPEGLVDDSAEERILSFVLGTLEAEPEDLSDVLGLGLGSVDGFMSRGPEGYAYFSGLLSTPLDELPEGVPQTLYLLALLLSGQEDPAGVLDRAALVLEVLNGALYEDRGAMLGAAVKVQDDLNEAASVLLALSPQVVGILATPDLPDDAVRDFVVQAYGRLTEGCFRRVTNLLLFAMFVAKSSPKGWEDVSDWAGFGEKHQWLADAGDEPAFRAALEGVEAIVRNSDAHSDMHFLDDGVRFVQTNFRTRIKEEKVFTDEELGRLVEDLTRTILSLSVGAQLFQVDNIREISGDLFSVETPRGLRGLYLELFLAVTGLLEPETTEEDGAVTVRAAVPPYQPPADLSEYVKTLFFVREFHPEAEEVALEVNWLGEWHCSLRAQAARLDAFKETPEHLAVPRTLAFLFATRTSSAALPERSDEEKLRELGFGMGCATAYAYMAETMREIELGLPVATPRARQALEYLNELRGALSMPQDVSREAEACRDELLRALGDIAHLYRTIVRVDRGMFDSQAIGRAERRYNRGADKVMRFAQTFPFSGRLF